MGDGLDHRFVNHRKRVKSRFLKEGLDHFEQHNQLELLLFYAIPQKDTNGLAHDLIQRFGSISRVMDAPLEELTAVKGIGENTAILLKLIPALARSYLLDSQSPTPQLTDDEVLKEFLQSLFVGCVNERVYLLLLDNRGTLVKAVKMGEGDLTATPLSSRQIIQTVLFGKTTSVILTHNHPAGMALPSYADQKLTQEIKQVLDSIEVTLLDHVVVSGHGECYSMFRSKLL